MRAGVGVSHGCTTTWANGVHPLAKPVKPPKVRAQRKKRVDLKQYRAITANEVTAYLREHPASTSADLSVLGASAFNTCRMLARLTLAKEITRHRETAHSPWRYSANRVKPMDANYVPMIIRFLSDNPGSTAKEVFQHTGVPDILSKIKRLRKRQQVTAEIKMTASFGRPVKHYFVVLHKQ